MTYRNSQWRDCQQAGSRVEQCPKRGYPRIRDETGERPNLREYESGVRPDYRSGKIWAAKIETPAGRVTERRVSLNMISAINPRGVLRFMAGEGNVKTGVFVGFLKRLTRGQPPHRRTLSVDAHPSRRAKAVNMGVESHGGQLILSFLPLYSPDLNPDEVIWNNCARNVVGPAKLEAHEMCTVHHRTVAFPREAPRSSPRPRPRTQDSLRSRLTEDTRMQPRTGLLRTLSESHSFWNLTNARPI